MPPTNYEFRVSGRLSERVQSAVSDFGTLQVFPAKPETVIYGPMADQSQLHGLLVLLENLGLHLVSMRQVPDCAVPDSAADAG